MTRIRSTKRRNRNYRDAHSRILSLWRIGTRAHRPVTEIFGACLAVIDASDVTITDRAKLHTVLWALREYSVLCHARWQLWLDGAPCTSEEISAEREAGDEGAWYRVKGRHEYDDSHDPFYEAAEPEYLSSMKQRSDVQYEVWTGRPSWHQQRAGAIGAACGVYETRNDAERYVENYKKHHPDQPCFIREIPLAKKEG